MNKETKARLKFRHKLQKKLSRDSGRVKSSDPLVGFLYTLLRDHVTPGQVQELVMDSLIGEECHYTNGYLAKYATHLAKQLKGKGTNV